MMSKETVNLNQEKVKQKKPKKKYGCLKGVLIFILVLLLLGGAVYGAAYVMLSRRFKCFSRSFRFEKGNGCHEYCFIWSRFTR